LRDVEQLSFLPGEKAVISKPVSLDQIYALKGTNDAIEYACELANLRPKQIAPRLGKDKTAWSRIVDGERDLYGRDVPKFNRFVGNSAYLLYLNHLDGWDLATMRRTGDDKDRRIAELEQAVADRDRALRLVLDARAGK
jgi:plasmid maintenance system antidote protein VapI